MIAQQLLDPGKIKALSRSPFTDPKGAKTDLRTIFHNLGSSAGFFPLVLASYTEHLKPQFVAVCRSDTGQNFIAQIRQLDASLCEDSKFYPPDAERVRRILRTVQRVFNPEERRAAFYIKAIDAICATLDLTLNPAMSDEEVLASIDRFSKPETVPS